MRRTLAEGFADSGLMKGFELEDELFTIEREVKGCLHYLQN